MIGEEIRVLDHGFVRLDAAMADDLSVVNSARVSFGAKSTLVAICGDCQQPKEECGHTGWHDKDVHKLAPADAGLIKFLMRERHGTPFEHNSFRFHVKLPLMVVREWQRHRIASYNELSGRYKKFENPEFYIPEAENIRTQVGKPGAYTFERWQGNTKQFQNQLALHYRDSVDLYNYYVEQGVAKEQARLVLPLALYTEMYYTTNARSLMNFLSLRNEPQAQWEIQQYAAALEEHFHDLMPATYQAFIDNGRVAP